jgi:hypothetical protein
MSLTVFLTMGPRVPDLQSPANPTVEQWKEIARGWYKVKYTYYDNDEATQAYIDEQGKWLSKNVPDELREGVFLLSRHGGFMGENVYVVDGRVTHNTHVPCRVCRTYEHVWRNQEGEPRIWCITCNDWEEPANASH